LTLECNNLNQILDIFGFQNFSIGASKLTLSLDPEDIPSELAEYVKGAYEKHIKFIEVLQAIQPFLLKSSLQAYAMIGDFELKASFEY
jgi:hypothetical protein